MVITITERGYEGVSRIDSNGRPIIVAPDRIAYKVSGIRGVWRRFEDAVRLVQIMLTDSMCEVLHQVLAS